jgi:hypothetical protein
MKIAKKIAPLFTAMILCGTLAARPDDGMFINPLGAPPPPRIKDWVEILYVGPLTSPEPVIWFTHERYRARGINVSIVLSNKNYEHLIRFVRSRDCLALSQIPMETAEIAIIEKSLGSVRRECFYERNSACAIFGKLVQASFTTARPGENYIRHLSQRIGCRMGRAN